MKTSLFLVSALSLCAASAFADYPPVPGYPYTVAVTVPFADATLKIIHHPGNSSPHGGPIARPMDEVDLPTPTDSHILVPLSMPIGAWFMVNQTTIKDMLTAAAANGGVLDGTMTVEEVNDYITDGNAPFLTCRHQIDQTVTITLPNGQAKVNFSSEDAAVVEATKGPCTNSN